MAWSAWEGVDSLHAMDGELHRYAPWRDARYTPEWIAAVYSDYLTRVFLVFVQFRCVGWANVLLVDGIGLRGEMANMREHEHEPLQSS